MPETSPQSVSPVHVEGASNPQWRSREAVALDDMTEEERALAEVNIGGSRRHYPLRPNILDGVAVMGGSACAMNVKKIHTARAATTANIGRTLAGHGVAEAEEPLNCPQSLS